MNNQNTSHGMEPQLNLQPQPQNEAVEPPGIPTEDMVNQQDVTPNPENELDAALNGQEPTSKNLILAAIGVMKNRKARPDSKRISNWINRRYGRPMSEVEEELERLVSVGELARVDYKGSASFRIVSDHGAKAKRRRRGTKPLGRAPSKNPVPLGGVFPAVGPPGPVTTPPGASGPPPPLTLRTLVIEMLGESAGASIESGIAVNTQFIAKAVESTNRNIYRAAVLGNLDLILAKEVDMGCFIKVGEDQYKISPYVSSFQQHHSLMALNPPLAHPPPSPVPVQQLLLDPQSRGVMTSPEHHHHHQQNSAASATSAHFSPNHPHSMPPPPVPPQSLPASISSPTSSSSSSNTSSSSSSSSSASCSPFPSDEQRKNDLIAAKLSKLEGKSKSPSKKAAFMAGDKSATKHKNHENQQGLPILGGSLNAINVPTPLASQHLQVEIKREFKTEDNEDLPLTVARSNNAAINNITSPHQISASSEDQHQNHHHPNGFSLKSKTIKRKKQPEIQQHPHIKQEVMDEIDNLSSSPIPFNDRNNSRISSSRKKKSRKIFDPADHDQPKRRKAPSPPAVSCSSLESSSTSSHVTVDSTNCSAAAPVASVTASSSSSVRHHGGSSVPLKPPPRGDCCIYCGRLEPKQKKGGRLESIIRCNDCPTSAHPSCMDYSEKLIKKIFQSASWQCTNCKTCHACQEVHDDDFLLLCDSCDLGYHMACHRPPVLEKPPGKWECSNCSDSGPPRSLPISNGISSMNNSQTMIQPQQTNKTVKERDDETARFLSILPSHLHPNTGLLPDNWEDYEVDPRIPDVSEWEPVQIRDFFSQKGFSDALSDVFLHQEIDGRSLLLLHRSDVVSSLGLKLGPALKLFSFIKKLQTRRNFPDY